MKHRLRALDWMRGIAMVLMATDHASGAFNAVRPVTDSVLFGGLFVPLDAGQFLFRWLSHLCAPAFLFLAGTSLALSVERKRTEGSSGRAIDCDLLIRGLLVLGVDLFLINFVWIKGTFLLQVMYAIGLSMICMIGLRRLSGPWLIAFALAALVVGEWTATGVLPVPAEFLPAASAFLIDGGLLQIRVLEMDNILAAYPVLPWCAMMAMGWVLGRYLLRQNAGGTTEPGRSPIPRVLGLLGAGSLVLFLVLRKWNGFGNLGLVRLDDSLVQWLHVSKYPPSLSFAALELGLMLLILAGLFRFDGARRGESKENGPLLVFGQTAFFFYLAHIFLLEAGAHLTGLHSEGTLGDAMVAFGLVLVVLYPLCKGYRRLKASHPQGVLRYF